jgi:putative ABC transport system permease protein
MVHVGIGMITGSAEEATRFIDKSDYDAYIMQRNRPTILMGGRVSDQIYEKVDGFSCIEDVDRIIDDWIDVKYKKEEIGMAIFGIDYDNEHIQPWDIIEGNVKDLKKNNTLIVDKHIVKYFPELELKDKLSGGLLYEDIKVVGFCQNTRRTGNPGGWTNFETARRLLYLENESTYLAVKIKEGFTIDDLKDKLEDYDDEVLVYSAEEMRENTINFMIFDTGLAGTIGIIAVLGFLVAMIVISITLYQSVKEKIPEFVSMKALGASKSYINNILVGQTVIIVSISYVLATITAILLSPSLSFVSTLSVSVNPIMAFTIYGISLALGILSSLFSIRKIQSVDPGIIFRA